MADPKTTARTAAGEASPSIVPYYVLKSKEPNGKSKAIFTVRKSQLSAMTTAHPILCRGAAFQLQVDAPSAAAALTPTQQQQQSSSSSMRLLSTTYHSPHPEETAREIAKRLAKRLQDSNGNERNSDSSSNIASMVFL